MKKYISLYSVKYNIYKKDYVEQDWCRAHSKVGIEKFIRSLKLNKYFVL